MTNAPLAADAGEIKARRCPACGRATLDDGGVLPPRIADFDGWYADLKHQVETATSVMQIANAIEKLAPYHEAKLCLGWRMAELAALGAAREKAIRIATARNPAGAD